MRSEIITPERASSLGLHILQQAVYARYANDGTYPAIGIQESHGESKVSYIVLHADEPIPLRDLNPSPPHAKYKDVMSMFNMILAFMSVEVGAETEVNLLVKRRRWPRAHAVFGDLVIHPFLQKERKDKALLELFGLAQGIVGSLPTYILTIDQVLEFAQRSGHTFTQVKSAKLNMKSQQVQEYTAKWGKYWRQDPALYRVRYAK